MDSSSEESNLDLTNSDEEYTPAAEIIPEKKVNPLRAMLNRTMAKSETGRKILEEEK